MLRKQENRIKRHKKIRAKLTGKAVRPRLCVFRSANHIYAQMIDDERGKVLLSVNDLSLKTELPKGEKDQKGKINKAREVGRLIASKAIEKKIDKVIFDRGGHKYHGRIKALAEGAREGGLKF